MKARDLGGFVQSRAVRFTLAAIVFVLALIVCFPPHGRERFQFLQFIGRFHPLAVHFPIALILLVPVLELAGKRETLSYLRLSSRFVLGIASISATAAAFLGWCLARSGSYSGPLVTQHMWSGITLAVVCWLCWVLRNHIDQANAGKYYAGFLSAAVLLVAFTGYRGGQLSEGEEHLTEYMPSALRHAIGLEDNPPLAVAAAGSFYAVRVQPIFAERCVSCHGPSRQKSNLRLDSYGWLMRGGKHGTVVLAGNAGASDLVRRITLSPDQEGFMPKEKKQPVPAEQVKLIELWIGAGASGTLPLEAIKDVPAAGSVAAAPVEVTVPQVDYATVAKAREGISTAVAQLQSRFPDILNYESRGSADLILNASLLGHKFGDEELRAFLPLAERITVADFSRTAITDRGAPALAAMKRLRVLKLAETKITDATVKELGRLDQLESLNVYGTLVTAAALPVVEKLPKLEHFYAGQTAIRSDVAVPQGLSGKLVL